MVPCLLRWPGLAFGPYRLVDKAVVNRCAVGIYPSLKLLDWARGLGIDVDVAAASEPCLYLIPDYDTQEEAAAAVLDLLAHQSADFDAASQRVLDKNQELYRRLA